MNYIYISSGEFGATVLNNLNPLPQLVVTQPDRLGGRGMKTLISTPVKTACKKLGIKTIDNFKNIDLSKYDLALVVDYGMKIPDKWLTLPKYSFWNIHPSLLPKYRGTAPIQTAIINKEKYTGVSIIKMDALFDHGPILKQAKLAININDNALDISQKLAKLGAKEFNQLITDPDTTITSAEIQNHMQATFTEKLIKQNGNIPIEQLVFYLEPIFKKIRQFSPYLFLGGIPALFCVHPNLSALCFFHLRIGRLDIFPSH